MKNSNKTISKKTTKPLNDKKQAKLDWEKLEKRINKKGLKVLLIIEGEPCNASKKFIKNIREWSSNKQNIRTVNMKKAISKTAPTYFQPLINHLPKAGQITIFENCWYEKSIQESELGKWDITLWNEFLQKEEVLKEAGYIVVKYAFNLLLKKENSLSPIFEILKKTEHQDFPFIYIYSQDRKEEPFKIIQHFSNQFLSN